MAVRERYTTNAFMSLLNRRAKHSLYATNFAHFDEQPHRLEYYLSVRGIRFIDDAKAQTINAIWYSLESLSTQITLIISGFDNAEDLLQIKDLLQLKVVNLVFVSKKNKKLDYFEGIVKNAVSVRSVRAAVEFAYEHSAQNDAVLFCGSKVENIEKESLKFRNAVRGL